MLHMVIVSNVTTDPSHVKALRKSFKGSLLPDLGLLPASRLAAALKKRGESTLVDGVDESTAQRISLLLTEAGIRTRIEPAMSAHAMVALVHEV